MKKALLLLPILALAGCGATSTSPAASSGTDTLDSTNQTTDMTTSAKIATIETPKGTIRVALSGLTPQTSGNFEKLANSHFYDGLTFHRYEPGFVVQGGDPLGNGTGGSDQAVPLEIPCADGTLVSGKTADCTVALPHGKHVIAMARSEDPNSATSQFYFTLAETPFLDGRYAVFGSVIEGGDVVDSLRAGDTMTTVAVATGDVPAAESGATAATAPAEGVTPTSGTGGMDAPSGEVGLGAQ